MKRYHLLLITVLMGVFSSQAYVPLVREGVKWVYNDEYYSYNEPDIDYKVTRTYTLEIKGDTIIDGMVYKKCYRQSDVNLNGHLHALFCSDVTPVACLREENCVVYVIYLDEYIAEKNRYLHDYPYLYDIGYISEIEEPKPVANEKEQILYDFNDERMQLKSSVFICGNVCGIFKFSSVYKDYNIVKGVGIVNTSCEMLDCWGAYSTSLWYSLPALHHMEDAEGNIIYKGIGFHSDGSLPGDKVADGKIDVSDVNSVIDVVLHGQGYDPVADVNGDGIVDISDVNALIDIVLGK